MLYLSSPQLSVDAKLNSVSSEERSPLLAFVEEDIAKCDILNLEWVWCATLWRIKTFNHL